MHDLVKQTTFFVFFPSMPDRLHHNISPSAVIAVTYLYFFDKLQSILHFFLNHHLTNVRTLLIIVNCKPFSQKR